MPDIIQRIRDAYSDNPATALKRLPELFKQYDEGRIPVLPCKPGTTIFTTRWWDNADEKCTNSEGKEFFRTIQKPKVTKESFSPFSLDYSEFGKTVFLSREAAEAALKERGT